MASLYLDVLNDDILLLLISKLDNIGPIVNCSFKIRRLIQDDNNCRVIFKYKNVDLYNFIINVKNIAVYPSWIRLLGYPKFWDTLNLNIDQVPAELSEGRSYLSDILYSYHLSLNFPKFYYYVKDVNLDNLGASNVLLYWREIYIICNKFKDSKFIQGTFTAAEGLKVNEYYQDIFRINPFVAMLMASMFLLILLRNNVMMNVPLEDIYEAFLSSSDVYIKMLESANLTVVTSADSISNIENIYPTEYVSEKNESATYSVGIYFQY